MNHLLIGQIAGILSLVQILPYIVSTLRGHTKPARASYFIWTIVNILFISSYISAGATTTIWLGLSVTLTGLITLLLSFKYGVGGYSKFDILCLILALSGAALWIQTSNPVTALYCMSLTGAIGFLPTIKKLYTMPGTENKTSWLMVTAAGYLNLFALTSFEFKLVFPLVCGVTMKSIVVVLILFPNNKRAPARRGSGAAQLHLRRLMFAK